MCKFYQGEDDGKLETMLGKVFSKVNRVKPETSRSVSSLLLYNVPSINTLSIANIRVSHISRIRRSVILWRQRKRPGLRGKFLSLNLSLSLSLWKPRVEPTSA